MKKIICILLSITLIIGSGVISANAMVNPDTHMASMTARLQEELLDDSTDTVQVIFFLYDYSPMWEDYIYELVYEKYDWSYDHNWTESDYDRFDKYSEIERSRMLAQYNDQFCYEITEEAYCPVHVDKVLLSSRKDPMVVVEAKKADVEKMAKDYTDVESMDLYVGILPNNEEVDNPFKADFEAWTYINNPEVLEQDIYPPYTYKDLYLHNRENRKENENPYDWVLCQARYNMPEPEPVTEYRIGGAGGRLIVSYSIKSPFECGYGVFDVTQNEYYGLEDIANDYSKYDGLLDALAENNVGSLLGDVNGDNEVDIIDATLVQKYASDKAGLDDNQRLAADVNGDYSADVFDAAEIQKFAVS